MVRGRRAIDAGRARFAHSATRPDPPTLADEARTPARRVPAPGTDRPTPRTQTPRTWAPRTWTAHRDSAHRERPLEAKPRGDSAPSPLKAWSVQRHAPPERSAARRVRWANVRRRHHRAAQAQPVRSSGAGSGAGSGAPATEPSGAGTRSRYSVAVRRPAASRADVRAERVGLRRGHAAFVENVVRAAQRESATARNVRPPPKSCWVARRRRAGPDQRRQSLTTHGWLSTKRQPVTPRRVTKPREKQRAGRPHLRDGRSSSRVAADRHTGLKPVQAQREARADASSWSRSAILRSSEPSAVSARRRSASSRSRRAVSASYAPTASQESTSTTTRSAPTSA